CSCGPPRGWPSAGGRSRRSRLVRSCWGCSRPSSPRGDSSREPIRHRRVSEMNDLEQRLADVWTEVDELDEQEFLTRIEALTSELPADSAVAVFERGAALDSTGHSDLAVPLY